MVSFGVREGGVGFVIYVSFILFSLLLCKLIGSLRTLLQVPDDYQSYLVQLNSGAP